MDPRDQQSSCEGGLRLICQELKYPPSYILVRLQQTKINVLSGLPSQVVSITPFTKTFDIQVAGEPMLISRCQLPITPAYAFTNYRAKGQTISPFNIYVALSRVKGQDFIRLLHEFNENLMQQYPNEYLHVEDEQLLQLGQVR